jgi:hypothetical protein
MCRREYIFALEFPASFLHSQGSTGFLYGLLSDISDGYLVWCKDDHLMSRSLFASFLCLQRHPVFFYWFDDTSFR